MSSYIYILNLCYFIYSNYLDCLFVVEELPFLNIQLK